MAMKFDPKKDVTRSLKFKPLEDLGNLCLGTLEKAEVIMNDVPKFKNDGSESPYEFAGHTVPSLRFTFKNFLREDDKDRAERWFNFVESVIIYKKNDGTPMKQKDLESIYEQMWDRIKHIHDAYKNDVNYKPFGELPEIDEKADVEARIIQFTKFFKAIAEAFNKGKNDKPIFVDQDDNSLPVALKLVPEYQTGKWLTFPTYVGEGFIERYHKGVPLTIELKPGETVTLKGGKREGEKSGAGSDSNIPKEVLEMINQ